MTNGNGKEAQPQKASALRPPDTYAMMDNHVLMCTSHDNAIRWAPGERLDHLYEARADSLPDEHLAVVTETEEITFQALDRQANRLARYLLQQGVRPGDRVGLIFAKSPESYIAMLAVMKVNAAYVPMDISFPTDRIAYILQDADVGMLLSIESYREKLQDIPTQLVCIDQLGPALQELPNTRLETEESGIPSDELAYIIYTSGSTGHPKGVAIDHPSICNFVRVAAEVYGICDDDRIYQGMTLAFDFSVEEIWVPLMAGATLVPGQADGNLVGEDLADFIKARQITALCCVPTLLATIDEELPNLRFLLVSGEACPQDIVRRWYRDDRILLNAYGPTEATVTATLTALYPGKPVTIGGPLPTYYAMILPPDRAEALPRGETGELCLAGIALARGYVNRQEQTDSAFIPDFLDLEDNPSSRIYRTGDLARINEDNEIEYLGRIDTQVKIRGYRIELTEIESVFMQVPQIAQAVVNTQETDGIVELVAYYTLYKDVTEAPSTQEIIETLRRDLPAYMLPSYLERLDTIPMLPSHKADRKKLPPPSGPRVVVSNTAYIPPSGETEEALAKAFAEVMRMDFAQISATDDFFKDLGAHSLLMAKFAALVRDALPKSDIAMRDIYTHPTISGLAQHIETAPAAALVDTPREPYHKASDFQYYLCGTLQFLSYIIFFVPLLFIGLELLDWTIASTSPFDAFSRVFLLGVAVAAFSIILPVAAKQLLIGAWKPQRIEIWSLSYFRFWLVKSLIRTNPFVLFRGTPLYNFYLRMMGANIGRDVVILGKVVPVCTDLITIGDNTILQQGTIATGYKAENGYIYIGPVSIGKDAYVGEGSVLEIHTSIGDGAQLGRSSSLHTHQEIPAGKQYHGSPAIETTTNYRRVSPMRCTALRKAAYVSFQLVQVLFIPALAFAGLFYVAPQWFGPTMSLEAYSAYAGSVRSLFAIDVMLLTMLWFVVGILLLAAAILTIPRVLSLFLTPDKEYVLYGIHYWIFRWIEATSNTKFFNILFGDTFIKPHFMKWLGWDVGKFKQTGTNFGLMERHDHPLLCTVGVGTMISDMLHLVNSDFSTSSFKVSHVKVGNDCFLGNTILYPADAKMGDNCLFATKVLLPIDGPIREGVGILGSPPFEIPRSTFPDPSFTLDDLEQQRIERLPLKNKSNMFTLLTFLFLLWFLFFQALVFSYVTFLAYAEFGLMAFVVAAVFLVFYGMGWSVLKEWMSLGFKRLQPKTCTIYEPYFWGVEHYWKHCSAFLYRLFPGTPFKPWIARMLGVKMGKRVFDNGMATSEGTLLEFGDYCIINESAYLQSHSLEDGFYKADMIKVGDHCTLGTACFIHYGVELTSHVIVEADSFFMKGEVAEPYSVWAGNPARRIQTYHPDDKLQG